MIWFEIWPVSLLEMDTEPLILTRTLDLSMEHFSLCPRYLYSASVSRPPVTNVSHDAIRGIVFNITGAIAHINNCGFPIKTYLGRLFYRLGVSIKALLIFFLSGDRFKISFSISGISKNKRCSPLPDNLYWNSPYPIDTIRLNNFTSLYIY